MITINTPVLRSSLRSSPKTRKHVAIPAYPGPARPNHLATAFPPLTVRVPRCETGKEPNVIPLLILILLILVLGVVGAIKLALWVFLIALVIAVIAGILGRGLFARP